MRKRARAGHWPWAVRRLTAPASASTPARGVPRRRAGRGSCALQDRLGPPHTSRERHRRTAQRQGSTTCWRSRRPAGHHGRSRTGWRGGTARWRLPARPRDDTTVRPRHRPGGHPSLPDTRVRGRFVQARAPWSAARRSQRAASAQSCGTLSPLPYRTARLNCATASPCSACVRSSSMVDCAWRRVLGPSVLMPTRTTARANSGPHTVLSSTAPAASAAPDRRPGCSLFMV